MGDLHGCNSTRAAVLDLELRTVGLRHRLVLGLFWQCVHCRDMMRQPAGPRRPHYKTLPGFIIWKLQPYRPGSFLHNRLTLVI